MTNFQLKKQIKLTYKNSPFLISGKVNIQKLDKKQYNIVDIFEYCLMNARQVVKLETSLDQVTDHYHEMTCEQKFDYDHDSKWAFNYRNELEVLRKHIEVRLPKMKKKDLVENFSYTGVKKSWTKKKIVSHLLDSITVVNVRYEEMVKEVEGRKLTKVRGVWC